MAVVVALCALFILIAIRTPIGISLAIAGTVGIALLQDFDFASSTLAGTPANIIIQNGLIIIPLFVLMGYLLLHAGLAKDLFDVAARVIGTRVPGGLGVAAVLACAAFAGVTGSSAATVASIGRISYLEMRRHGYRDTFAAGIVAMAGTLGVMIPPSSFLVVYAILAGVSIQDMLLAGILPGLLSAAVYSVIIIGRVKRPNQSVILDEFVSHASAGAVSAANGDHGRGSTVTQTRQEKTRARVSIVAVGVLFATVIGGMYLGVFTATEAGAIGAAAALVLTIGILALRRKSPWRPIGRALLESTTSTSMIALLLVGGGIFSSFLVLAGIPRAITQFALGAAVPSWLVIAGLLVVLLLMGTVLDGMSIMLIITPLAVPVLQALDYDLIWFGILLVKMIEIGLVTPPLGINVYVLAGGVKGLAAERAFAGVVPFWLGELVTVVLIFIFPAIALILPQTAAG